MIAYVFKQIATINRVTVTADSHRSAKKMASELLKCRPSSCIYIPENGIVNLFTLKNLTTKQKFKIKADDLSSARAELAAATGSKVEDWIFRFEETVSDSASTDIQYLSFDSNFE